MNFADWFTELKSNPLWWMRMQEMYCRKNLDTVANETYTFLLGQETRFKAMNFVDFRSCFFNFAKNAKDEVVRPQLQQIEVKEDKDWIPVTGEERAKRLKEWEAIVKGSAMVSSVPRTSYKELAEEGGILPPKPAPYPCTSKEEAYIRDRRFEYIKYAYEPRTGEKRPDVLTEEEFNKQFDSENL